MGRMIIKHFQTRKPKLQYTYTPPTPKQEEQPQLKEAEEIKTETTQKAPNKTKSAKKEDNKQLITEEVTEMTTAEKVELAQSILNTPSVKKIKKDNSLIERVDANKSIITDDNKELLVD